MKAEKKPDFTIVMPHYDGSIDHYRFVRSVESLRMQSYPNWELLIYHDGPTKNVETRRFIESLDDERVAFFETSQRYNDWGHSLRDKGIAKARGEYLLHLNADNVLYQNCLAILFAYSLWPEQEIESKTRFGRKVHHKLNPGALVFGVKMMGCLNIRNGEGFRRFRGEEHSRSTILPGWPPNKYSIDAMQLVARTEFWRSIGGWIHKHEESDGELIETITKKFGYFVIPEILGEHW